MAYVPKLDRSLELRFYVDAVRQSSCLIYAKRESRVVEFQARGLGGSGAVTRSERVTFTIRTNSDIDSALLAGNAPRIFDETTQQEYLIQSVTDSSRRDRAEISCVALPPGQPS